MSRSNRREVRSSDRVAGAAQEAGSRGGSKKNKKNKKSDPDLVQMVKAE